MKSPSKSCSLDPMPTWLLKLCEDLQSAYRRSHSIEAGLLKVQSDILESLDNGCVTVLVILDMSAVFDTLDHGILLSHFENVFGNSGSALKWIASYLPDRSQVVVIDSEHSKPVLLKYGVPQGSVLGQKKYTMYAKPLGAIIRRHELSYHFYADDTQLYISFKSNEDAVKAQSLSLIENCLTDIEGWMRTNMLKLNNDKTEVMLFTSKHDAIHMENVTFKFEATRGRGGITLVALDDIALHKGHCHQVFEPSCTFEQHKCGWSEYYETDPEVAHQGSFWCLHCDNDIGHGKFLYLIVRPSPSHIEYSRPSIISPWVTPTMATYYCVRLRLYTSDANILVAIRRYTWPNTVDTVWKSNGDDRTWGRWRHVAVTISVRGVFRIVVTIMSAQYGDSIAIDDVIISYGQCHSFNSHTTANTTTGTSITSSVATTSATQVCAPDERLCRTDNVCVKASRWCNGLKDCPGGEDENIGLCSAHLTAPPPKDADSAKRRPTSVLTILIVCSGAFLLVLVAVSLTSICLISTTKRRHIPRVRPSSLYHGSIPAVSDHVVSTDDLDPVVSGRVRAGLTKYRPVAVAGTRDECLSLSVDANPCSASDLFIAMTLAGAQSRYLDPPPSYSSAVRQTPHGVWQPNGSIYIGARSTGGDVTSV
ncbi:hypothetical protein LSH36_330g03014 [Paralvinella palmiformis]|uniref:Reverse transcriptase domain-containing protein n=1 Tax=Paralvinella palmiformis TaxID=53620 RepID=A0AAD9JG45_9ANNE|nr:hypothetical protein LSH36_330g03014 [Paralvinella palmiformis]